MKVNNPNFRTSNEWYNILYPKGDLIIYDPDGWDRTNYQYSFHEEKITKEEFNKRLFNSTTLGYRFTEEEKEKIKNQL